ncbi:Neuroglobin [Geodia barretti]|uniref:Neuroglobin n=1 Tax=Geodia barretti TaxID=519541 RepID=A0AA35T0D7_GEOBA|nr:Neuroglobin [Geodia barretti]
MKDSEIRLVQDTFNKVEPIADTAAELFYDRLFQLDGDLKPLFHSDLQQQGRLLMKMVATAVDHLSDLDTLVPVVQRLGARHKVYGVEPSHYDTVGQALLWTLEQGLGEHFTPDVASAWANTYGLLSGVMMEAAGYEETFAPEAELSVT